MTPNAFHSAFRLALWRRSLVLVVVCIAASSLFATAGVLAQVPPVGASAEVRDAQGRLVANAEFREGRGEVLITILFPQPAALSGTHGVRIHEFGRCDAPDFSTAGNGFNPTGRKHGRQNPDGPQVGDLPNVNFTTGLTSYNTSTSGATLSAGPNSLLGPNKTSLVIYSGEDDQLTDPDGKAGSRIACGVVNAAAGLGTNPAAQPALPKPVVSPVTGLPAPVQPVQQPPVAPAQPQPGLPKPVAVASPSPVAAQAQPALPKPVVAASPSAAVAAVPTPVVAVPTLPPLAAAPSVTQTNSGGLSTTTALIIAVVGVGLVGAGWLLRRRGQLRG
ncbi:MAG TPA: superoxide dismutase family protein [Chloroflexota bacterium]|nr:superoxide dismutase family protein [Chloroflexota bacterium]